MKKMNRLFKEACIFVFFLIFLYIMAIINLYKITGRIDLNVFKSEGFPKFIILGLIILPIVYLSGIIRKGRKRPGKEEEKGE